MAKKVQKSKAVAKKAAKPVAKKAAKPVAKKVVKAAPKKVAKPVAKKAVKPVAKKVAKKVAKTAVKKASQPVAKKVVKPVAKKASKPVAKKVVKPVAKKTAKPVAKKAVKPVAKKATKAAPAKAKAIAKKTVAPAPKAAAKKAVEVKAEKATPRRKKKLPPPPMFAKPVVAKPKTVAELIEANKIPVEKNFPISKREMKTARPSIDNTSLYGNDKPVKAPIIGKTKFSDAELKEFKDLINNKLAEAIKDYELLKDTLSHRDNNGTDDTSPTFKLLEDGSEVMSKEETTQLAIRQEKFIQNLKNALIRIENKTYGVCRATGNMISKDRLRSVPHATLSIEAKRDQN
jgi:RNA polymerase-binding transcription factor DksA